MIESCREVSGPLTQETIQEVDDALCPQGEGGPHHCRPESAAEAAQMRPEPRRGLWSRAFRLPLTVSFVRQMLRVHMD